MFGRHIDHDLHEPNVSNGMHIKLTKGDHLTRCAVDTRTAALNARLAARATRRMTDLLDDWIVTHIETCTTVAHLGCSPNESAARPHSLRAARCCAMLHRVSRVADAATRAKLAPPGWPPHLLPTKPPSHG